MMKFLSTLMVSIMILATNSSAQESRAGRYTMHKADGGFVRLDTETGVVSFCRQNETAWRCQDMPGAAASSSAGLARYKRENAELKAEIKRLDELLGLRGNRGKSAANRHTFKFPTEKEVDDSLDYFERMLKKLQDRLRRLERKSGGSDRQL